MYKYKGIILYFVQNVNRVLADANADLSVRIQYDNSPKYVYMPLSIDVTSVDAIQQWITTTRESMKPDYLLYTPLYWYLDEYSCVLIERNRTWFQTALPKISDIWQTILKERVDGFEHRAPTKRKKTGQTNTHVTVTVETQSDVHDQTIHTIRNLSFKKPICLVKLE